MKFSTIAHSRWPKVRAGAENMLWQMEQFLLGKGWEYTTPEQADWILTQQMWSQRALGLPGRVCQIVHSTVHAGPMPEADLIVYNSHHVAEHYSPRQGVVIHPPVPLRRKYATIINLCEEKGPDLFWRLARKMLDTEFLAVRGGYGIQREFKLPNVTIWDTQEDMSKVWEVTRVLLVPSVYETYGIAPLEAAGQGIPVIAAPTAGLQEAVGGYATFVPRSDVRGWRSAIQDAKSGWSKDPTDELEAWHTSLLF